LKPAELFGGLGLIAYLSTSEDGAPGDGWGNQHTFDDAWTCSTTCSPLATSRGKTRPLNWSDAALAGSDLSDLIVKIALHMGEFMTRGEGHVAVAAAQVETLWDEALPIEVRQLPENLAGPNTDPVWNTGTDEAEKRFARQAEIAYRRLVADWQASSPKAGAGATPEHASSRPSKGKAARQAASS
jgi:hypothetical protein